MDAKQAGFFAQLAYDETQQVGDTVFFPDSSAWTIVGKQGYPASGTRGAYLVLANASTKELIFAFKGTNTTPEWGDDLFHSGRSTIANIMPIATDNLDAVLSNPDFAGYSISATGHSLGGAEAQTFALEALAQQDVVVNTFYFDSLPISSTLLSGDIASRLHARVPMIASPSDAIAYYHSRGGVSQGIYFSGEIADFTFRTKNGGDYLDSSLVKVPSNTNALTVLGTLAARALLGPFGLLVGFLGVKFNAHRMSLLNEAMATLGETPAGLLISPNGAPPSVQEGQGAEIAEQSGDDITGVRLSNGAVVRENDDGSVTAERKDASGRVIETERYQTEEDDAGKFSEQWSRTTYDDSGNEETTQKFSSSEETGQIDFEQTSKLEGGPIAKFKFTFSIAQDGTITSSPSQDDLATNQQQAKATIDGMAADDQTKAKLFIEYDLRAVLLLQDLTRTLGGRDVAAMQRADIIAAAFLKNDLGKGIARAKNDYIGSTTPDHANVFGDSSLNFQQFSAYRDALANAARRRRCCGRLRGCKTAWRRSGESMKRALG